MPATREFFIKQVLGWVIDSPDLSGAFFDDVNAIATDCIYGIDGVPAANASGKTNAFGRCGNWTSADAAAFQAATVQTVKEVLAAFSAAGKWPLLSIRQDGTINQPLRDFQAAVNPLLAPHGAFRFMEALCQQYTMPCTLDGVSSNASACCVSQVEELVAQSAAGVPLAVHGWGEKHASQPSLGLLPTSSDSALLCCSQRKGPRPTLSTSRPSSSAWGTTPCSASRAAAPT